LQPEDAMGLITKCASRFPGAFCQLPLVKNFRGAYTLLEFG
jgi:hypothetical protein